MADTNLKYTLSLKDLFRKTMLGANDDTKKLDGSMNRLGQTASKIGGAIAGIFALSKIIEFTKAIVFATAAAASFNNAVIASSRTEGEGRANLQFLNNQVDRLGLNLNAARAGYKTFTGSVMGSNIQGEKSNRIFRQVSEASAVLGLSADQTEGSFLALGQMISKGTVQAEELRGQLAERIPGAFQIGARAMGMTTVQLGEAMKKGLIQSDDFLVKFGNELEKTFGNKLGAATQSVQSNLNKMGNEWIRLQENIGKSQTGVINYVTSFAADSIKALSNYFDKANIMFDNFTRNGVKDFGFWQKAAHETIGLFTGYNFGLSTITSQENFQKGIYDAYVNRQPKSLSEALQSKANLYKLSIGKDQELKSGKIDEQEAQRFQATIQGALSSVNQAITAFRTSGKSDKPFLAATDAGQQIGSPVDVTGARPQNITINVNDGLVKEMNIYSETFSEGVSEARAMTSKAFLELLNDANTISNR